MWLSDALSVGCEFYAGCMSGWSEKFKDGYCHLGWGEICGGDGVTGEAAEERLTGVVAGLGFGGGGDDRADVFRGGEGLQHAAVEEGGEGCVEMDDDGAGSLFEEKAVGQLVKCAAAEGEDGGGAGQSVGEGGGLELAEAGLAVLGEDVGDGEGCARLDVGVEVEEVPAEPVREQAADGGLTRAHEAGKDDAADGGGKGYGRGGLAGCFGGGHKVSRYWVVRHKGKPRPLWGRGSVEGVNALVLHGQEMHTNPA
jgi:hypothetical protein